MNEVTITARKATGDLLENIRSEIYPSKKAPNKAPTSIIEAKSAI